MGLPNDFNKTTVVSYALIVWVAIISFAMGRQFAKIEDGEIQREQIKEYITQEVNGLRADWDRDRKAQEKRLDKLEK